MLFVLLVELLMETDEFLSTRDTLGEDVEDLRLDLGLFVVCCSCCC